MWIWAGSEVCLEGGLGLARLRPRAPTAVSLGKLDGGGAALGGGGEVRVVDGVEVEAGAEERVPAGSVADLGLQRNELAPQRLVPATY